MKNNLRLSDFKTENQPTLMKDVAVCSLFAMLYIFKSVRAIQSNIEIVRGFNALYNRGTIQVLRRVNMTSSVQVNDYRKQAERYDKWIQVLAFFQILSLVGAFFTFGITLIPMIIFLMWGDRLEKKRKKLWIFNSGREESTEALGDLPEGYTILHNIEIKQEKHTLHINHVVIGENGIFLVKAKNWGTTKVIGKAEDSVWLLEKEMGVKTEKNPIRQVKSQVHHFSAFLKENGLDAWIQGIVYLSNRASSYQIDIEGLNQSSRIPVFMTDFSGEARLYDYIVNYPKNKTLSVKEQQRIIEILTKGSTGRKSKQVA